MDDIIYDGVLLEPAQVDAVKALTLSVPAGAYCLLPR